MRGRRSRAAEAEKRACCLVSEAMEESGLDREHVRLLRKQVLQGMILLCQWQLERMHDTPPPPRKSKTSRARRVTVE